MIAPTATRIVDTALASFATRGYEATSLDKLAVTVGVTKQAILHHFGSKEQLLVAVLRRTLDDVVAVIDARLTAGEPVGWEALETVVRAVFALAGSRPELLGFLREVGRLGPPHDAHFQLALEPVVERATGHLRGGSVSVARARSAVIAAYAFVLGVATELEVLRQLGQVPSARLLARRRRALLDELARLLEVGATAAGVSGSAAQAMPDSIAGSDPSS